MSRLGAHTQPDGRWQRWKESCVALSLHGHTSVLQLQGIQIHSPIFEHIAAVLLLLLMLGVLVVSASE